MNRKPVGARTIVLTAAGAALAGAGTILWLFGRIKAGRAPGLGGRAQRAMPNAHAIEVAPGRKQPLKPDQRADAH